MFYLTTHSTHFILRLYGVGNMVKDHSDSERRNPLPPHGLFFPINSKGSFICTITDSIAHTTTFVRPVVEHWLEREIAQSVHPMKDRSDDPSHHERTLLPRNYISLPNTNSADVYCFNIMYTTLLYLGLYELNIQLCVFMINLSDKLKSTVRKRR